MGNPALWTAVAACIGAVAALVQATRAHNRATDAQSIAIGHALDKTAHPAKPRSVVSMPPPPAAPSSRGGQSSG